jgi:hypothetical protein
MSSLKEVYFCETATFEGIVERFPLAAEIVAGQAGTMTLAAIRA